MLVHSPKRLELFLLQRHELLELHTFYAKVLQQIGEDALHQVSCCGAVTAGTCLTASDSIVFHPADMTPQTP